MTAQIPSLIPWDHQREGVRDILATLIFSRSALWSSPTGSGKSWVFCEVAKALRPAGRVLFVVRKIDLVWQAAERFRDHGLTVGVEQAAARVDTASLPDVTCASVDTLRNEKRRSRFDRDAFALIIVDEADLSAAPSFRAVLDHFNAAKVLGVTATPQRHDGKPMLSAGGGVYDRFVGGVDMLDLMARGILAPIRQHTIKVESVALDTAALGGGDYNLATLNKILMSERALHEVVRVTLDHAGERPTLAFACGINHARALADLFNRYRAGSARAVYHGDGVESGEAFAAFVRGDFQFLVNVEKATRGVDLPPTACLVMARPTMSETLYTQMMGRGTRVAPGKVDCLVLDFVGNGEHNRLVTCLDVLANQRASTDPHRPKMRAQRAREILDAEPGLDAATAIKRAEEEIDADPELRERVRAIVVAKLGEFAEPVIPDEMWHTMSNLAVGRSFGRSSLWAKKRRPDSIPSPALNKEWRKAALLRMVKSLTPEQRSEKARKSYASLTPDQKDKRASRFSEMSKTLTREQRLSNARKAVESLSPDQRRARAVKGASSMSEDAKAERARAGGLARQSKLTKDQRRENMDIARAALTTEQRSVANKKAWVTRRAKQPK